MKSRKYNKLGNITEKRRLIDTEKKLVVTSGQGDNVGVGASGRHKLLGVRQVKDLLYYMGNTANIL